MRIDEEDQQAEDAKAGDGEGREGQMTSAHSVARQGGFFSVHDFGEEVVYGFGYYLMTNWEGLEP
jgi:hypothetical protein